VNPTEEYLRHAASVGLVDEVHGLRFVSDRYDDPFSGRRQVLVEYCDPGLPASPSALTSLREALRGRGPELDAVVLRVVGDGQLPPPWRRRMTYVRHERRAAPAGDTPVRPAGGLTVRQATGGDDDRVRGWLVQAFRNSYPGHQVDPGHPAVKGIMADPCRLSFIAEADGRPIGHGTVLTGEQDPVTGETFAELVDTLVDDPSHRRAAITALVTAIVHATEGSVLCGHVMHPKEPAEARQAEGVLRALVAGDWSVDHCFWECPW
jgi:hypothetical protein